MRSPVPTPDRPLPETIGTYRVQSVLGLGGMGVVYAAVHSATGARVAIKTVKSLAPKILSSLRSEVQTLRRVSHPGVVKMLDEGLSEGLPWYAMELLEGQTLHESQAGRASERSSGASASFRDRTTVTRTTHGLNDAPAEGAVAHSPVQTAQPQGSPPFELTRAPLGIYRGVCEALEHLHHMGLVHRDLKPSNVFLRDGRTPVLMDFGLASLSAGSVGREELGSDLGTRLLGTLPYLSPEQIRGELVDARADLYALGCMLYETISGRPPFSNPDPNVVRSAHLFESPRRLSEIVDGVPSALDDLVSHLLKKSRHERLGRVSDVIAALATLGAESPFGTPSNYSGQIHLYRPRLLGRDALLAEIDDRREQAAGGQGSIVLLRGESGVGKTFLAAEAGQRAGLAGFRVITGECSPPVGGRSDVEVGRAPLHPFRRLLEYLADRCREGGPEISARVLGERTRILARFEPSLAFAATHDTEDSTLAVEPDVARSRVLNAFRATLHALSQETPVVLVVDDLHWADELSLDLLTHLAAGPDRLLIIGTLRNEEVPPLLQPLLSSPNVHTISLARLDSETVEALVADMLAIPKPLPELSRYIAAQSEGNPFFAAEYLRLLVSENRLRLEGSTWNFGRGELDETQALRMPVPGSIRELADTRLASLEPEARVLLETAAVLGREFETDLLVALVGDQEHVFDGIEVLRQRQLIESRGADGVRFIHDAMREAIYAAVATETRRALHLRIAQLLELRHGWRPDAFDLHPIIAHHWSNAGQPASAGRYLLRSARHARSVYANAESRRFYEGAIDSVNLAGWAPTDDDVRAELMLSLHEELGEVLLLTSAGERAEHVYHAALSMAAGVGRVRRARILRNLGKTRSIRHLHANALSAYGEAEQILGDPTDGGEGSEEAWREWVEIRNERVWAHYWMGDSATLTSLVRDLRPVVERHGTALQKANFYRALCLAELRRERYRIGPSTIAYARAALTAARTSGDAAEIASTRFNFAFVLLAAGELSEADVEMNQVIAAAERFGDVGLVVRATAYASLIARRLKRVGETWILANKAHALAEQAKMPHYLGMADANLGWVEYRRGNVGAARVALDRALATWQGAPPVYPMQWLARWPLLALDVEAGNVDRATEAIPRLMDATQERPPAALEDLLTRMDGNAHVEGLKELVAEARRNHYL